jgi:hypothetical protein
MLARIRINIEIQRNPVKNTFDIHWNEVDRLNTLTDKLETDLLSVSKLLSKEVPLEYGQTKMRRDRS